MIIFKSVLFVIVKEEMCDLKAIDQMGTLKNSVAQKTGIRQCYKDCLNHKTTKLLVMGNVLISYPFSMFR